MPQCCSQAINDCTKVLSCQIRALGPWLLLVLRLSLSCMQLEYPYSRGKCHVPGEELDAKW